MKQKFCHHFNNMDTLRKYDYLNTICNKTHLIYQEKIMGNRKLIGSNMNN